MQLIVFIGPPGSGKGSLSKLFVQRLGCIQLSTGSLCRKHVAEMTPIGRQIDFFMKSGTLVSDELIVGMVADWLKQNNGSDKRVILDGFPRTVEQARLLRDLIQNELPDCLLHIIQLAAADSLILQRLSSRYICENNDCQTVYTVKQCPALMPKIPNVCDLCQSNLIRRFDDRVETVTERLKTYHWYEQSLIDFFTHMGYQVNYVDVDRSIEMIFNEVKDLIIN